MKDERYEFYLSELQRLKALAPTASGGARHLLAMLNTVNRFGK